MKSKTVLFLLLIAMGFIVVVYEGISSTTCKKAADRDPIQVTVETEVPAKLSTEKSAKSF